MSTRDTCLVCCRPLASEEEASEEWRRGPQIGERFGKPATIFPGEGPLCISSNSREPPFVGCWDEPSRSLALDASSVVWGVISLALWARKACRGVPRAPDPSCEECKGGGRMIVWFNNTDGDETDCTCTVRR